MAALNEWNERPLDDEDDLYPDHIATLGCSIFTVVMMSRVGFGDAQNALEVGQWGDTMPTHGTDELTDRENLPVPPLTLDRLMLNDPKFLVQQILKRAEAIKDMFSALPANFDEVEKSRLINACDYLDECKETHYFLPVESLVYSIDI